MIKPNQAEIHTALEEGKVLTIPSTPKALNRWTYVKRATGGHNAIIFDAEDINGIIESTVAPSENQKQLYKNQIDTFLANYLQDIDINILNTVINIYLNYF